MTPGPTLVLASPCCGHLHRLATIRSGNTLGAALWSDGKFHARMLPQPPSLARCRGCRAPFWVADAAEVGRIDDPFYRQIAGREQQQVAPEWSEAADIDATPDIDTLIDALPHPSFGAAERQRKVRVLLWHELNEPRRSQPDNPKWQQFWGPYWEKYGAEFEERYGAHFRPNLEALLALLDESQSDDRLQKAEALRELGHFEACIRLLDSDFDGPLDTYAEQIRRRALAGDRVVFRLDPPQE
jgi:hypothetical protein